MPDNSSSGRMRDRQRYVFDRRLFRALAVHWALLVIAVPVFVFWDDMGAFSLYLAIAFVSFLILTLTKPTRYMTGAHGRSVCPALKRFFTVICILMVPLALTNIIAFFSLVKEQGGPEIYNGVYCLWNHGFIREISREEYIRLCRLERTAFTANLALIRSVFMLLCCFADQVV